MMTGNLIKTPKSHKRPPKVAAVCLAIIATALISAPFQVNKQKPAEAGKRGNLGSLALNLLHRIVYASFTSPYFLALPSCSKEP
jgi:hypothetical protein